jgi:signal transduction histidine kinase
MAYPDQRDETAFDALSVGRITDLVGASRDLLTELDLERILEKSLLAGRAATGARYAAIGVLDESHRRLLRFETSGIDDATHRNIGDLPQGHGILGLLISDPRPLRLDNVGSHPKSYGFPIGHPRMTTFLGVPIRLRGEIWGNFYLTDKGSGEPFDEADEAALVLLSEWIGIAVANAEVHRREVGRRTALQREVAVLEATSAIARAVSDETDLDRILELVVKRGRALIQGRATAILLLDGEELVVSKTAGELGAELVGRRSDVLESLCGQVLVAGKSRRFDELGGHPRLGLLGDADVQSMLCVPLYVRGRALGVLAAVDRLAEGPAFTDDDERLFDAFATSSANAVATAKNVLEEGLRRAIDASERERTRWARELHDDPLQELAALKLALSRLRRAEEPTEHESALSLAERQVDLAVEGLRGMVTELRPAALDELGPAAALQALADRAAQQGQLEVSLRIDLDFESGRASTRHAPEVEETIYRVVQESLSNVIKHAAAQTAEVSIVEAGGTLTIRVRDDGRGMSGEASATSYGLIGMRERLALVAGTLRTESQRGKGTLVEAVMPSRRQDGVWPPDAGG